MLRPCSAKHDRIIPQLITLYAGLKFREYYIGNEFGTPRERREKSIDSSVNLGTIEDQAGMKFQDSTGLLATPYFPMTLEIFHNMCLSYIFRSNHRWMWVSKFV